MKTDEFTSSLIIHFSFPTSRQSKKVFHHIHLINYSILLFLICKILSFTLQDNIPKTTIL